MGGELAGRPGGPPLTYLNGGLPPQEQLEALGVVRQAAVMQGCAALPCLFVQIPTGRAQGKRKTKNRESRVAGVGTAQAGE